MNRWKTSLVSSSLFCIFASSAALGDSPKITDEAVDRLAQPFLDAGLVNALSIGIVDGDQTRTRHYGLLSEQSPAKPTDNTIYEIGSISKVFTGVLLARAVETGRVNLDDPISSIMHTLESENKEVGDSILLRHLSTHTSGLPRLPSNLDPVNPDPVNPDPVNPDPYAMYDRKLLTEFMCEVKPSRKPGELLEYSNLGVGLLGDLISAEAGKTYQELLVGQIATPLKMSDTRVELPDDQRSRLAPPHNANRTPERNWGFDALAGAGGIRSTTADMTLWIQANLNPPEGPLGDAINLAWKQHLPAKGNAFAMGLGWHIARDGQTRWHSGQTGGYHTMILINRSLNVGVVALCNTATPKIDQLAESIIQTMAGIEVKPAEFPKEKSIAPDVVARLQGRYQLFPGLVLTARADKDKLFVQLTNQPELRVFAASETEWKYRIVEATLHFELPEKGESPAVTLHQNGRKMRATRIESEK